MYNWKVVHDYYAAQATQYGVALLTDEQFTDYYLQNLSTIVKVTGNISKSSLWEGIQIKSNIRINLVDMLASLFMGMAMPLSRGEETIPSVQTLKDTIDFYTVLPEDKLFDHLSTILKMIVPNINDVLNEFQHVISTSQELHYIEVTRVMYLSGIFMGNAFVHANSHPEGKLGATSNIFSDYIDFLNTTFESIDKRRGLPK